MEQQQLSFFTCRLSLSSLFSHHSRPSRNGCLKFSILRGVCRVGSVYAAMAVVGFQFTGLHWQGSTTNY
ncbi:uncharacterized protein BO88DRAFT_400019 [Aspergillus vadensis CBS 113365]|uniref:Uncharacterized protein n=1 Tax=Aspergillus vadensis (strain CBS 113365 / IMI 142717 / IBT 24658) TaxID=1448311 RepID=A0A319BPM9_ASPVC|nr:hypothetical protein BO88DRAFT_400019 [Aspergillus vadensis CBS 113365]PYH74331.1 hypothetical protein BO88DRAFT_400019 [Aspergillus vadensis CBS 113365]